MCYAGFIIGDGPYTQGSLSQISLSDEEYNSGFLALMRLVGTVYFKKNASGFEVNSPEVHFKNFIRPTLSPFDVHIEWLKDIRESIWVRIDFENEMLPSVDALLRHWKRTCWVIDLWKQADRNVMCLSDVIYFLWVEAEHRWCIDN